MKGKEKGKDVPNWMQCVLCLVTQLCLTLQLQFQRIARRDKKTFLSEQCIETEGNNRTGKTRDHFKKTGDTKGTFHSKTGTIKDKNGKKNLTETEEIKKRWQEYPDLYKKKNS